MKFKSGDNVRFLNDTGGGTVSRSDDRGFIYVLTEDGFEIPVTEKDLVISGDLTFVEPEKEAIKPPAGLLRKPVPDKPISVSMPKNVPFAASVQLFVGFIPENTGPVFSSTLACYLINDSAFLAYYHMGFKEGGEYYFLSAGMIEPDTKSYIRSFDQTSVSKISDLHIQIFLVNEGKYYKKEPVDKLLNLTLVNFSKESYYRENEYFEEKALLFNVHSGIQELIHDEIEVPDEIKEEKLTSDGERENGFSKRPVATDTLEVDLHLDELIVQNSQLTPSGILALQMSRFHSAIEEAVSKKLRRIVIIHGMGQGTLKMQIRRELQEKYPEYIYQDASFKEYGFGATLVYLNYK